MPSYNEFKSVISQVVQSAKLLPLSPEPAAVAPDAESSGVDYLYEPSPKTILDVAAAAVRRVQVYRALLESAAASMARA